MKPFTLLRIGFALALFLFPLTTHASDLFVRPDRVNMAQFLVRYGAINIYSDDVIDTYLMLSECSLYQNFFTNEFKWQAIRDAMRKKIKQDVETYPTSIGFVTELQMDRYDFKTKLFKFKEKSAIKNVNSMLVFQTPHDITCGKQVSPLLPRGYRVILNSPLYIDGLPFSDSDAKAFYDRLFVSEGNKDRIIYGKFNIRILYVSPLHKREGRAMLENDAAESTGASTARMDGHIDSVEFYEDEDLTKLIYTYRNDAM